MEAPAKLRVRVLLHLAAGAAVALLAILCDRILGTRPDFGPRQMLLLAIGIAIVALGFVPGSGFLSRVSSKICLGVLSLFFVLALCETSFRAAGFDFAREEVAWRKLPPCYREPIVPTGEVFFRRQGPQTWHGQVMHSSMEAQQIVPAHYRDEPEITVDYDERGFRNPDNMTDWVIAIAGDSFTEMGYLPHADLFTTRLGKELGVQTINLSASHTGPLSHLSYLREYGVSENTKHAIIVFFEGNDLKNLSREYEDLMRWRERGERPRRDFAEQPSFMSAIYRAFTKRSERTNCVNAYFDSASGDIPVTLSYAPPRGSALTEEQNRQLDFFFDEFARFGTKHDLTLWLAFMPSKRRVLHGMVEFSEDADEILKSWRPTDFPQVISDYCARHGVAFVDLSLPLVAETRRKRQLVYNSVYDTHLNAVGSQIVAKELAMRFSSQAAR